ncbi:MAG: DUF4342 domain-containing protein [bacterium]|nr:DUF4342 domain-containing protein [bacterium]
MTNPETSESTHGATDSTQPRQERTFSEEFRVSGEAVIAKVKELVREGNVRRITIKNEEGKSLIEVPLTIGVIGTVLLPVWAVIGAIAALVANLTIAVERVRPVENPVATPADLDAPAAPIDHDPPAGHGPA